MSLSEQLPPVIQEHHIYTTNTDVLGFWESYTANRLLNNSIVRTVGGYDSIRKGSICKGCSDILLARIESVASASLAALSVLFTMPIGIIGIPIFLCTSITIRLGSRLPGLTSCKVLQDFTLHNRQAVNRAIRISLIALPVIFLFIAASSINVVIPFRDQNNIFFSGINFLVGPLGEFKTVEMIFPRNFSLKGSTKSFSLLEGAEEYLRAFSCKNKIKQQIISDHKHHRYTYTSSYQYSGGAVTGKTKVIGAEQE